MSDNAKRNKSSRERQLPPTCFLQETPFRPRDTCRFEVRGWKTIYYANGCQKKAGVAIHIPDKLNFQPKTLIRDQEGHYILLKGSIQHYLTIINTYAPNTGASINLS